MEFAFLGWPEDGPTLDLDHETFAYAGKFVTPRTGKAVARDGSDVVAAACFNEDRGAANALRIRYVTVREDRRGERIGPRLLAFVRDRALERYDRVRIAVNNPAAYVALYRAGFGFTGEETGMAELVLEAPQPDGRSTDQYRSGLELYAKRDLPERQRSIVDERRTVEPPDPVDTPR